MIKNTGKLFEIISLSLARDKIIWPIIIFAVSRNPKVTGRTEVLKNSIIEIKGANHKGVPRGKNCARNLVILYVSLEIMIASQVNQEALKEKIV
jgi:hypothetical protein